MQTKKEFEKRNKDVDKMIDDFIDKSIKLDKLKAYSPMQAAFGKLNEKKCDVK